MDLIMDNSSDEESEISYRSRNASPKMSDSPVDEVDNRFTKHRNVVEKLFNREIYTSTSRLKKKCNKVFDKIPPRLRFCLMDIVPTSYLSSHIFMGFSQCGQYLLSFTFDSSVSLTRQDIRESYSYRLHFLLWVPGQKAKSVHSVPLFDDDSVDTHVDLSIAQWKHNPNLLVVYGIAKRKPCTERSYLSVIGVPRLGCKKCSLLSNTDDDLNLGKRCLEHNFAIHTKFYCTSDSSSLEPVVQLAYLNQIIIYTDFIHILEIDYVKAETENHKEDLYSLEQVMPTLDVDSLGPTSDASLPVKSQNHVVQNILADFSDLESDVPISKPIKPDVTLGQELCIQASSLAQSLIEEWEGPSHYIRTLISPPLRSPRRRPIEGMSRFNESYRKMAEKTYEFVDETETKCEKLSLFRKRRLADKKYEFSEDNNENIVPFRVLRSNRKYYIGSNVKQQTRRAKSPTIESVVLRDHKQINVAPPSPTTSVKSRLSSIDRDDRSESEYRLMAVNEDGTLKTVSVHDHTSKTLSDCVVSPQDPYLVHSGNSKCSKFFTRYFVESDDEITSIITDSEDDCLSGYHVGLPLTAHGAAYMPLQPIGVGAWERLTSGGGSGGNSIVMPELTLRARQRSLDTELLCNEVCGRLCKLNSKKFIYCFDWGCHVIDVCQSSGCLCGVCAMWFWASEPNSKDSSCEMCLSGTTGCLVHKQQLAAECLFVWDLVTGVYRTERVSMKEDSSQEGKRVSGAERARQLAAKFMTINAAPATDYRLLTTLTGRSVKRLTDLDHCIEITKKHTDSSDSECSMDEQESEVESEIDSEYINESLYLSGGDL